MLDLFWQVFMLSVDAVLDEATLLSILESGHSRIPVHKPGNRCADMPAYPCRVLAATYVARHGVWIL